MKMNSFSMQQGFHSRHWAKCTEVLRGWRQSPSATRLGYGQGGNDENRDDLEVERKRVASDKVLTVVQGRERQRRHGAGPAVVGWSQTVGDSRKTSSSLRNFLA